MNGKRWSGCGPISRYREMFRGAFPDESGPLTLSHVVQAIACFERTLIAGNSPYSRLVYHDDRRALSPGARRGMCLFFSERTRCSRCHAGFNFSGPSVFAGMEAQPQQVFHESDLPEGPGQLRAPTLHNVAVTAPYMHDGSVATLDEVVDAYANGRRGFTFTLSAEEKSDLVDFLHALTDREFLSNPRFADPFSDGPDDPSR